MIKDGDKLNQVPPSRKKAGERLKASEWNNLVDAVGNPRVLRENKPVFKRQSLAGSLKYPFQLIIDPDNSASVAVRCGMIGRGEYNTPVYITTSPASGGGFSGEYAAPSETDDPEVLATTSYAFTTGATYRIYMVFYDSGSTTWGDAINGTNLQILVDASDTPPNPADYNWQRDSIHLLGYVTVDGGVITIQQQYFSGSHPSTPWVTDADNPITSDLERISSIEESDLGDLQLYGIDDLSDSLDEGKVPYCYFDPAPGNNSRELRWAWMCQADETGFAPDPGGSVTGIMADPVEVADSGASVTGGYRYIDFNECEYTCYGGRSEFLGGFGPGRIDLWPAVAQYLATEGFSHTDLDDMPSDTNTDHDGRYWRLGELKAACYGQEIGYETTTPSGAPQLRIDLANHTLNHTGAGLKALDFTNMECFDNSSNKSLDWEDRQTLDVAELKSLDWDARQAFDSTPILSIDWEDRQLIDSSAALAFDWEARQAVADDGSSVSIDWSSYNDGQLNGNWFSGHFSPQADSTYRLGGALNRWSEVYSENYRAADLSLGVTSGGFVSGLLTDADQLDTDVETIAINTYLDLSAGGF